MDKQANKNERYSRTTLWLLALLMTTLVVGCGGGDSGSGGAGAGSRTSAGPPGSVCAGANCVSLGAGGDLGAAAGYAILAKSGVDTVPTSVVTGNVGLSPTARVSLTGWSETAAADASDTYSTSPQVVAPFRLYASDYAPPAPTNLTTAVLSMEAAYTEAAGKAGGPCPGVGAFGAPLPPLAPGNYTCAINVTIPADFTLNGTATDVWVFQITGTLTQAADTRVLLTGGALPQNVFWQVSGAVSIGARAHMEGIILGQTSVTFGNLSSVNGRLYAQTAVNINATTVTQP